MATTSIGKPASVQALFPKEKLVFAKSEADGILEQMRNDLKPWIQDKAYDKIEARAMELRQSKKRFDSGNWYLELFYEMVIGLNEDTEAEWQKKLAWLREWVAAAPKSATAHFALARFWRYYAWHARGGGFANTVTEAGWKTFGERLEQGTAELALVAEKTRYPEFYDIAQDLLLGAGASREEYFLLFNDAVKHEPDYPVYWMNMAFFLQERWHGVSDSEWVEFANKEATLRGGEAGDILYAQIVSDILRKNTGIRTIEESLRTPGLSWPRLKQGYQAILAKKPDSTWALGRLSFCAVAVGDYATARMLFLKMGNQVPNNFWTIESFAEARDKVFPPATALTKP